MISRTMEMVGPSGRVVIDPKEEQEWRSRGYVPLAEHETMGGRNTITMKDILTKAEAELNKNPTSQQAKDAVKKARADYENAVEVEANSGGRTFQLERDAVAAKEAFNRAEADYKRSPNAGTKEALETARTACTAAEEAAKSERRFTSTRDPNWGNMTKDQREAAVQRDPNWDNWNQTERAHAIEHGFPVDQSNMTPGQRESAQQHGYGSPTDQRDAAEHDQSTWSKEQRDAWDRMTPAQRQTAQSDPKWKQEPQRDPQYDPARRSNMSQEDAEHDLVTKREALKKAESDLRRYANPRTQSERDNAAKFQSAVEEARTALNNAERTAETTRR